MTRIVESFARFKGERTWLFIAFVLIVHVATMGIANAASVKDLAGEWKGSYRCFTNKAELTLSFQPNGEGRFIFSYRNGSIAGEYELSARILKSGEFRFKPGNWIKKANGIRMVGLQGKLSSDGQELSGLIFGCREFLVKRISPAKGTAMAANDAPVPADDGKPIDSKSSPELPAAEIKAAPAESQTSLQPKAVRPLPDASLGDSFKFALQEEPTVKQTQTGIFEGSGELVLAGVWKGGINCGANGNKPMSLTFTPSAPGTKGEMTVWDDAVGKTPALRFTFSVDKLFWKDRAEFAGTAVKATLLNMPYVEAFSTISFSLDNYSGKGQPFPEQIYVYPAPNWGCSTYTAINLSQAETFTMAQDAPLADLPEIQKFARLDPDEEAALEPCSYSTSEAAAQCLLASYRNGMRSNTSVATAFISHTLHTISRQREIQTCALQRRLLEDDASALRARGVPVGWAAPDCNTTASIYAAVTGEQPYYSVCARSNGGDELAGCLKAVLDPKRVSKMAQAVYPVLVRGIPEPTSKSGGSGKFDVYQLGLTAREGDKWEVKDLFTEISNALYFCKRDPNHKINLGRIKDVLVSARTGMDENASPEKTVEFTCAQLAGLLNATGLMKPSDTEGMVGFDKCGPDRANQPPLPFEVQKTTAQGITEKMCTNGRVMVFFSDLGKQVSDFEYRGTQCVQGAFGMPLTRFDFDFNARQCELQGSGTAVCEGEAVVYCESTSRDNIRQTMTCGTASSYSAPTTAYYKYDPKSCEWQSTDQSIRMDEGYPNR